MLAAHERKLTITHTNHSTMLYLQPMRNQLLILAVVLGIPGPLLAQDREYLSDPDPTCILSTDKETWMSLGLTTEQLHTVEGLQTACETDCTVYKKSTNKEVALPSTIKEYQEKVLKVIGEEKYVQWLKWCANRAVKG